MGTFIDLRHPFSVRNLVSVLLLLCTLISWPISAQDPEGGGNRRNGANGNGDYGELDNYGDGDYDPDYGIEEYSEGKKITASVPTSFLCTHPHVNSFFYIT